MRSMFSFGLKNVFRFLMRILIMLFGRYESVVFELRIVGVVWVSMEVFMLRVVELGRVIVNEEKLILKEVYVLFVVSKGMIWRGLMNLFVLILLKRMEFVLVW